MKQTVMIDNRTAGTTIGRQHATYHHATSLQATQHREVTPRTAARRARPALLLASLLCLMTLTSCYDYQDELYSERELAMQRLQGEVKLAMTFNDNKATTRMTATETQATEGAFLGVTQIYAIPFAPAEGENKPVAGTDTRLDRMIGLGPILSTDGIGQYVYNTDPNESNVSLSRSKLYFAYPKLLGTTAYLAYAVGSGDSQTHGRLAGLDDETMSTVEQPKDFSFEPVSFYASATDAQKAKGQALADYLTSIANVNNGNWGDYADVRTAFLGLHAAASIDVAATVAGLYSYCETKNDLLASAIKSAITNNNKATISGTGFAITATLSDDLSNFPSELGLPDGAAAILGDENEKEFVTSTTNYNLGMLQTSTSTLLVTPLDHFVYPMPLVYRTNSPVVTSELDESEHYLNGVTWASIISNYDDGYRVHLATQSVAIKEQLNYAVARLETYVRAETSTLVDKQGNEVELTNTTFPVTGILVGGQKKVDFEFHPDEDDTDYYVVYDATIPTGLALTTTAFDNQTAVHTLLLESEESSTDKQKVPVAIEFRNDSGREFYGVDGNMVPKGAKFYLAGQIDMSGEDFSGERAFTQDYVATLKCTVTSLENAYNVIPDLRDTRLKIGLTVLPWIVSTPSNTELF